MICEFLEVGCLWFGLLVCWFVEVLNEVNNMECVGWGVWMWCAQGWVGAK